VTHIVVHHSATANAAAHWAEVVRNIWRDHALTRGWGDIGYNFLIDPNGVIYEGRAGGDDVIGAHFSCMNGHTMGVCLLGTYSTVSPSPAALESLKRLLAWKVDLAGIDPLGRSYHPESGLTLPHICGHRDGNASSLKCSTTECPGGYLYNLLPTIRTDVAALISAGSDSAPPTISSFSVSPSTINPGQRIAASYTVSDSGGSGLNRVELWRANVDGGVSDPSWTQLQTRDLRGTGNGPTSGTFSDSPPGTGSYWYGIHVVDNAGNLIDERRAGQGPRRVDVLAGGTSLPTVSTLPATLVTANSARIWGRVDSDGGGAILERRFDWGVAGNWTGWTSNVTVRGSEFYFDLSGLAPNTTYQFRAWARNSSGWSNSSPAYFTTLATTDSDDQISEAMHLGAPGPSNPLVLNTGNIDNQFDVDMYSFDVTAGQRLAFDVDRRNGSALDSYLRLFNAAGTELAKSDDDPAPGEESSLESYLEYAFTSSGRYFVAVSGYPNSSYDPVAGTGDRSGSTGEYSLIISDVTPDTTPPSVTINQAAGQLDPTSSSPINFTVVFSEPVTGFDSSDVLLGGTAGATTCVVTGSGTTYNVAVSGMTQSGTVTATVRAGAAQDAAGNLSLASTSTDNTVSYLLPNRPPDTPNNQMPANGSPNQALTVVLKASAFFDPDAGDTHAASQWVVRRRSDNVVVFDSGEDAANKTSCSIPAGILNYAMTYSWQVRYKDSAGAWSAYSAETTFTTVAPTLVARIIGGKVVLTWPANADGFILFSTTNLTPNAPWTVVTPSPVVVSDQKVVTNAISGPRMFYRLLRP
jgi:hypothetical protein